MKKKWTNCIVLNMADKNWSKFYKSNWNEKNLRYWMLTNKTDFLKGSEKQYRAKMEIFIFDIPLKE